MKTLSPVQKMFDDYGCRTNDERRGALKEIVQEITLLALDRAHFFTHAAFYGGTCLRIFHGLDRFSEDLDFSLLKHENNFSLESYLPPIQDELAAYGFEMTVEQKQKTKINTAVQSAFIKGGTLVHLIKIAAIEPPVSGVPPNEQIKIKIEIDTDLPAGASFEVKYRLSPVPYSVQVYDKPSLFAGKLHALLCRHWKLRAKGRDFYDYVWYLAAKTPLNITHLEARMRQSGHWKKDEPLNRDAILALLEERFASVDFVQIKSDAAPFVKDTHSLDLWTPDFFMAISKENLVCKQGKV